MHLWLVAALVAGLMLTVAPVQRAGAAGFTVTSAGDSGAGTLRQAILDANSNGLDDTITFDTTQMGGSTITLTSGELLINSNIAIDGTGITISGDGNSRIFRIDNGTVAIDGLTITDGKSPVPLQGVSGQGGAMYVAGGTVTLNMVTISASTAVAYGQGVGEPGALGGGLYVGGGTVTLTESTITGNTAGSGANGGRGGGVFVTGAGVVALIKSTLKDNNASGGGGTPESGGLGGGLYVAGGSATLTDTTVNNNEAQAGGQFGGRGGGLFVGLASATLTNSTVSGNTAAAGGSFSGLGGGFYIASVSAVSYGSATLTNSTVNSNTAGGGAALGGNFFFEANGTATLANTIVANGGAAPKNCNKIGGGASANVVNTTNNLDDDASCVTGGNGSIVNQAANLGTLADNGGPTWTHLPLAGSPAIDAGDNATCAAAPVNNVDQRGFTRPRDGDANTTAICEIGAVEIATPNPAPQITQLTPPSVAVNSPTFELTVSGNDFVDGVSRISFDGSILPTTFVSANSLKAMVPASALIAAGDKPVVVITDAPGGGTSNTLQFKVDGLATPIELSATNLDFGDQLVGTTSTVKQLTLTNNNGSPLAFTGVEKGGANADDFAITFNTCVGNLPAGQSCVIAITFTPAVAGARAATVTITDDAAGSPRTVTLAGNGVNAPPPPPPGVTLQPTSLTFARQLVGTTSTARPIKLTNGGGSTLVVASVELVGANAADYAIDYETCVGDLPAGQSCVIGITFTPSAEGTRSASLRITDNAAGSPRDVPLSGVGALGTFNVTATTTGPGTITPSGVTAYTGGSQAAYTATPTGDAIFLGWSLDGVYVGYASTLSFAANGDRSLHATFAARPSFGDVPTTDADYQAIVFLAAMGIINPNGVNGSGNFEPDRNVVRAEMAAFIARIFDWDSEFHNNPFPDQCDSNAINCVDNELWNNVAALADYGIVGGYTDGPTCASAGTTAPCYLPRDTVKRVQVLSIVARAFIKTPDQRPTGFWDRQTANLDQYTNVPNVGTQRSDLTTYTANAGLVPGAADDSTFPNPEGNGLRRFVIQAIYQAFAAQYATDRVP